MRYLRVQHTVQCVLAHFSRGRSLFAFVLYICLQEGESRLRKAQESEKAVQLALETGTQLRAKCEQLTAALTEV